MVSKMTWYFPKFEVRYKNTSWLMRFLGVVLYLFNRKFMTDYTTTLGYIVYFPSRKYVEKSDSRAMRILTHEFVHIWDRNILGWFKYTVGYMFPQICALVPLLAMLVLCWFSFPGKQATAWILGANAIGCLFPWPAPWRMLLELRGYTMSAAVRLWWRSETIQWDWIYAHFTGWDYYRMWPYPKDITERFAVGMQPIFEDRPALLGSPFVLIKQWLQEAPKP
jgi:hypothetical protein